MSGKVVVITGASSGIGRAGAIGFAAAGCQVVVSARRADDLAETASRCGEVGSQAMVMPADVTDEQAMLKLAAGAMERFGRIDVWVNNAGVTLFAPLETASFDAHKRVIETNLFGAMLGARAAIPIFRRQRHGILINVGSVLSEVGQPFVPSYVVSKFAVRGLSEVLRVELADEPDIHVCSLLPYAVDTPHFQDGANQTGLRAHAMPPVQSPEKVAHAMVQLAARPRREWHVPRVAALGVALHWLLPGVTERLLLHAVRRWHVGPDEEPPKQGNLWEPSHERGRVHGERPPQVSTPAFAAWVAAELLKIQTEAAGRRIRRWSTRDRRPPWQTRAP